MLKKLKADNNHHKSKQKAKQSKTIKETNKTKKSPIQKVVRCQSKKLIKPKHQLNSKHQDCKQQNQNFNKSNLPTHYIPNQYKLKATQQYQGNPQNNIMQIKRSFSMGGLRPIKPARKSLSPALNKQSKEKIDLHHKYSSKPTSRSQKQKIKQKQMTKQKRYLGQPKQAQQQIQNMKKKKSFKNLKVQNNRLKTDNSLKAQKQIEKKIEKLAKKKNQLKKKEKKVSKNIIQKSKITSSKPKQKLKKSIIFSDESSYNVSPLQSAIISKQNFMIRLSKEQQNLEKVVIKACVTIQKHFRGYLTRKIIQQQKYIICCVIKIQKAWRSYLYCKRQKKDIFVKKNLSIENSLLTIKDFSQEPKEEKLKNKSFNFNFQEDTTKMQSLSIKKAKAQSQQKLIDILETILQQQTVAQKVKQKIRGALGKQQYVQNKIKSQIFSQRSFNSPRQLVSPKGNTIINSPSSWSKLRQKNQIISQHYSASPKNNEIVQAVNKRINSPSSNISASNSKKRQNTETAVQIKLQVKPIQTSFEFIQQFQLRIVDFLRDNLETKQFFLTLCKQSEKYRTYFILSRWRKPNNIIQDIYIQTYPQVFPTELRQEILSESSMKIYLVDNNYQQKQSKSNKAQKQICQSYLKCIFDGLTEAIYQNYKSQIITKKIKGMICNSSGHQLFKIIFMNSLTMMQGWTEYMCGAQIPVPRTDPNYEPYCQKNNERLDIMVKNQINSTIIIQDDSWKLWADLQIGELVFKDLIQEMWKQFYT